MHAIHVSDLLRPDNGEHNVHNHKHPEGLTVVPETSEANEPAEAQGQQHKGVYQGMPQLLDDAADDVAQQRQLLLAQPGTEPACSSNTSSNTLAWAQLCYT